MTFGLILLLALTYGYINGRNGSASVVATLISSRALNPRGALMLAAAGVLIGPFLFGVAVANTVGAKLISPQASTVPVLVAALIAMTAWTLITAQFGIPSSTSQTLVGSMMGAAWAGYGRASLLSGGLKTAFLGLFLSPLLGAIIGFFLMLGIYRLAMYASPHVNWWFQKSQIFISFLMAMAFGANDGQKTMGLITFGLVATHTEATFNVPLWVIAISAVSLGLGTWMGGWQLIRTLAGKFYKIRPIEGFGAQMTSSMVILGAALLGAPVSSSQVVTSAIIGVGSADRIQKIRWHVVARILLGWGLTIPISGALGALIYYFIGLLI